MKNSKLAKTQIVEHDEMLEDNAIISIDPKQEDEKISQKPGKFFTNKSKSIREKDKAKNQNNLDGFAGDARRKE